MIFIISNSLDDAASWAKENIDSNRNDKWCLVTKMVDFGEHLTGYYVYLPNFSVNDENSYQLKKIEWLISSRSGLIPWETKNKHKKPVPPANHEVVEQVIDLVKEAEAKAKAGEETTADADADAAIDEL